MKCGSGWCCRHMMFIYGADAGMPLTMVRILRDELEVLLLRDVELFWDAERGKFVALVTSPCSKILGDGRCGFYGSRPDACRSYPVRGAFKYLTEACSFFDRRKHGAVEELEAVPSLAVVERILLKICGKSSALSF